MDRRLFLQVAASAPLIAAPAEEPAYRVVSPYKSAAQPGMPGPYPGQVVRVHSENSIDTATASVNREIVKQMLAGGMKALTGDARPEDAWARFISPKDVVGVKVNCSGAPQIRSSPEVVAGIVENLIAVGVPAKQIYVYERFDNQLRSVGYEKFVPEGVTSMRWKRRAGRFFVTIRRLTWRLVSSGRKIPGRTWRDWFRRR